MSEIPKLPIEITFGNLFENLKVIGQLKVNEKLIIVGQALHMQPIGLFSSLQRKISGDCRNQSIELVKIEINTALFLLQHVMDSKYLEAKPNFDSKVSESEILHFTTRREETMKEMKLMMGVLNSCVAGLANLIQTYETDKIVCDTINGICEKVQTSLFDYARMITNSFGNIQIDDNTDIKQFL
jgi:hypothetical protein